MREWFEAEHLSAGYGKKDVIKDVSFSVKLHTLTGLLGENGCGKTTLLRCIAGRLPHEGCCWLKEEQMEKLGTRNLAQRVSYIPQRSGISVSLPVFEVVLMGFNPVLGLLEQPSKRQKEQALLALEKVGLAELAEADYLKLSEGQKQLVIVARTLIEDSRLLLLDEPDSALDMVNRYSVMKRLKMIVTEQNKAGILCLHDPVLALEFCDQLLLIREGSCADIIHPKTDSIERMEAALKRIYGNVSLAMCLDKKGQRHLMVLWEDL